MSEIKQHIVRVNDQYLLKIHLTIKQSVSFKSMTIEYFAPGKQQEPEYILSTSEGSIRNNKVYITGQKNVIENCLIPPKETIDCLISFLDGDTLLAFETIQIQTLSLPPAIKHSEIEIASVKTLNQKFESRMYDFHQKLRTNISDWRLQLKVDNNIIVRVIKSGKETFAAFGKTSDSLLASDFVFRLYPDIRQFVIPREVFWSQSGSMSVDSLFGCFELVRADFHSANVYYKMMISNPVKVEDFPKQKKNVDLKQFTLPTGNEFSSPTWRMGANLPIWNR